MNKLKYGKIPTKEIEKTPCAEVRIDFIGPYMVNTREVDSIGIPIEFTLIAMTFMDPVIGWFKIAEVSYIYNNSALISQIFIQT